MADATFSTRPNIRLRTTVYQESQNAAGNYSTVRVILQAVETTQQASYSLVASQNSWYIAVGSGVWSGNWTFDFRPGGLQSYTLLNTTVNVAHDAAGNGSASISASSSTVVLGSAGISDSLSLTRIPKPADPPTGITLTPLSGGMQVDWTAPANNNGSAVTGYRVEAALNSGFTSGVVTTDVSGTTATLGGMTAGATYFIHVASKNGSYAVVGTYSPAMSGAVLGGLYVGVGGVWKDASAYVGINGVWVPVSIQVGASGAWKGLAP